MIGSEGHNHCTEDPTHPEEHPDGNADIAQGVPRHVADRAALDLRVGAVKLAKPYELDDLLRGEETSNGERLRGEGAGVLVMDLLHVRRRGHSVDLARKVDTAISNWASTKSQSQSRSQSRRQLSTHANDNGAMMRAVEREIPMLASGAVGSWSGVKGESVEDDWC